MTKIMIIIAFYSVLQAQTSSSSLGQLTPLSQFSINLPAEPGVFPDKIDARAAVPGFELRGTKGWAWTPEQYLAEIPYLKKFHMNFLMNCYLSMFSDPEKLINRWWEPLPAAKKKAYEQIVRSCNENGINFCFAMHPQLFSKRPYKYDSDSDFAALWQHYAWMQSLGVKWFSVSYDDISTKDHNIEQLGEKHGELVNRLLAKLRLKDAGAQMIFCPTYYWGSGDQGDAKIYLTALGKVLDKEVFVFWTGNAVYSLAISTKCAESYKAIVHHRLILWDNYPVNDRTGALHLGPVFGREKDLCSVVYGYMSNPLAPQNEINRIPLFTCADYAYNPAAYDPMQSIGNAIFFLGKTPEQRQVLLDLVELYPGHLIYGLKRSSLICVQEKLQAILQQPDGQIRGQAFIKQVEDVLNRLEREFPGQYANTKATIRQHLDKIRDIMHLHDIE